MAQRLPAVSPPPVDYVSKEAVVSVAFRALALTLSASVEIASKGLGLDFIWLQTRRSATTM